MYFLLKVRFGSVLFRDGVGSWSPEKKPLTCCIVSQAALYHYSGVEDHLVQQVVVDSDPEDGEQLGLRARLPLHPHHSHLEAQIYI